MRWSPHARRSLQHQTRHLMNPDEFPSRLDLVEDAVALPARSCRSCVRGAPRPCSTRTRSSTRSSSPYWAELWASGEALARKIAERDVAGLRVLELGCGLGSRPLPRRSAARACSRRTGRRRDRARARRTRAATSSSSRRRSSRWSEPDALLERAPWDLVLAADVLYERRNVDELLELLPRLGAQSCSPSPAARTQRRSSSGRPGAGTSSRRDRLRAHRRGTTPLAGRQAGSSSPTRCRTTRRP